MAPEASGYMIELMIQGRGGQGGVTLAKLIAQAFFLKGWYAQAFGVYAAERSGAPLQAYVRIDDREITNHNHVQTPDHVIILDRTLITPLILTGLKPGGWLILNTPDAPEAFADLFAGRAVATVDATALAVANGLGTRAVPIVNTTMLGAVARVLELTLADVEAALTTFQFQGGNITAARSAYEAVVFRNVPGEPRVPPAASPEPPVGLFDDSVGSPPRIQTGSWATRRPHRHVLTAPCHAACPAGNDIQGFVAAIGQERYDDALRILLETSPLPGVCGRVCPAPCMEACNRGGFDEPVNIRDLERFAADHGTPPEPDGEPHREMPLAVVGSGPAGLSAAYHLARLGYPVTIFESGWELGGLLRTGIPAYRLPRDVLDREVSYIFAHGVNVRLGQSIQREHLLDLSHRFAGVFLATGLQEARSLKLGVNAGGSYERLMQGIEFLDRARRGIARVQGEHVVVVGGGNTAIDAARTALRLRAKTVRIVYRRTRDEMPAIHDEVEAAIEEGVSLHELLSPIRLWSDGSAAYLTAQRMQLGEADESGRRRPVPVETEDAFVDLRCDRLLLALGQAADLSVLPEGSNLGDDGSLLGLTGAPIYCGGDFATYDGTVAGSIGSGRRAAWHLHRTLTGEDLFPQTEPPVAGPELIRTHVFAHAPRRPAGVISKALRRTTFAEVHTGLAGAGTGLTELPEDHPAVREAGRCFRCGVCNHCDRCVTYCPEGILERDGDEYRFDYDYCKGCGICAAQCPRGVIYMAEL